MQPTDKQVAFITKLGGDPTFPATKADASLYITGLLNQQAAQKPTSTTTVEPGVYEYQGDVYRVKLNKYKTRSYAEKLVEIGGTRVTDAGTFVKFDYRYAPGVIHHLTEEHRLTLDKAAELGVRYGRCLSCGKGLKDANSVLQGIGPVCIKHFAPVCGQLVLS